MPGRKSKPGVASTTRIDLTGHSANGRLKNLRDAGERLASDRSTRSPASQAPRKPLTKPRWLEKCHIDWATSWGQISTRPASHWDATLQESLSTGEIKRWSLHIGNSFTDASAGSSFYTEIETIFHKNITHGCGTALYCPTNSLQRSEMAIFILKSKYGSTFVPPSAIGIFGDVAPGDFAADWNEQMYKDGISTGCGAGNFCPTGTVTRDQMAIFLLRAKHGSAYTPPPATGTVFTDVTTATFGAAWIEELQAEGGVAAGTCGAGKYCPTDPTTRAQMAGVLTRTFSLKLYGP